MVKNLPFNAGDMSSTPVLGRLSREGNGYSRLENPMDRGIPGGLQSIGSQKS